MQEDAQKKSWIKIAVSLLILVGFSICPEVGPMPKTDLLNMGCFLTIIVGWVSGIPAWFGLLTALYYCLVSGVNFNDVG